jgi:riboflavin synthase alpha subunit
MFTGLIREIGTLRGKVPAGGVLRLDIEAPQTAASAQVGDSIAVNGICLTVTAVQGSRFRVEAATETRRLTTLRDWRSGQRLHLEPSLRAGDKLDGHLVQGHVDGTGEIAAVQKSGGSLLMTVTLAGEQARFLTPKGSVAVDGVSLTVDEGPFDKGRFTVNLIPHTLSWTTFGTARKGRRVNLEMDVLVKAARGGVSWRDLPTLEAEEKSQARPSGLTLERLLASGFGRRASKGRS